MYTGGEAVVLDFAQRDFPEYYVGRNLHIFEQLSTEPWFGDTIAIGSHSAGANLAALTASRSGRVSHLIYSAGNPFGYFMNIINKQRKRENDSLHLAEVQFEYWDRVVKDKNQDVPVPGSEVANKSVYLFQTTVFNTLLNLDIPVLVTYGTKDDCAYANDLLRFESIKRQKSYMHFKDYIGRDHNYFAVDADGNPNHEEYYWQTVARFWMDWLISN